ncbi:LLM class flavin-dependent oxidoreductase [Niallia sp. FSL W8-0635]|uniref:LLM class flavin-dependent oxidoreductase n=1 Tax=Niallia sp. FSL W8-0635 TaxID=2975337 RepID=UPI0009CAFC23|nr:luciferase-like monooxygenase [Mycobacteroides abscessus subsp. abscessus]HEO8420345.1 LLM class flavin-dependent oxidoreductase [Yersinia enterocolitica]HEO8422884.1 LLM class flavin-dependent oxidoreductase [Yersinia enterocolitica]
MKLSVLDQSVISKNSNAGIALQNTIKLAKHTEELGYTRFWVAEHHNSNGIAGTSPEILISSIAAQTNRIRVGSGGVLLPQYSPFKIAEDFKVLEALYPNRMDLGIGRSPGGSTPTRLALTDGIRKSLNEFPRQVTALQEYLTDKNASQEVQAYPYIETLPEIWMLGVSQRGARLAAEKGTAFTYGHFINPISGSIAMRHYRESFQPSSFLSNPQSNVCVFVVCAPTQAEAEEMALSQDLWLLAVEKGQDTFILSKEEAKGAELTEEDKAIIRKNRKRAIIGTPEKVKEALLQLSESYQTKEFMIITNIYDFEEKMQSYSLLAEAVL